MGAVTGNGIEAALAEVVAAIFVGDEDWDLVLKDLEVDHVYRSAKALS
jgi:hypothetical protein